MVDDLEARVARAFEPLSPSPEAAADLRLALAEAPQAPPARRVSPWVVGIAACAAVALVAIGLARHQPSQSAGRPVPDGKTLRVEVAGDGAATLFDLGGVPVLQLRFGENESADAGALSQLEKALVELTSAAPFDARGVSSLAVEVDPSADASWRWIQWILQAAANRKVEIVRLGSLKEGEEAIQQRLPVDLAQSTTIERVDWARQPVFRVTVLPDAGAGEPPSAPSTRARLRFGDRTLHVDLSSSAEAMAQLRDAAREAAEREAARGDELRGEIDVPEGAGITLPYEIIPALLRAYREAGVRDVHFTGARGPKAGATRGQ